MTLTGRTMLTLIFMLAVGMGIILATRLGPVARTAPLIVAIPTLGLLTLELVRDHSRGRRKPMDKPELAAAERRLIGWLVLLVALVATLGLMFGTAGWLASYLRLRSGERWHVAAGFGVGLAVVLYAVFKLVLRIPVTAGGLLNY